MNCQSARLNSRLSVRLAQDAAELRQAQHLRWRVFLADRAGLAPDGAAALDCDAYDDLCDHLLVIDEEARGADRVIGTYRLLRGSVARKAGGFYSSGEFDISALVGSETAGCGELLELGRSCVLPAYRNSATISLLWRGIADYIARHGIAMMFGCASFEGTDPARHAEALSYLHHNHLAPARCRPRVLPGKGISMALRDQASFDPRRAMLQLPPLVKAYLRVGAVCGDGAFIDHAFNTIDVCVVMPVDRICGRYASRFNLAA